MILVGWILAGCILYLGIALGVAVSISEDDEPENLTQAAVLFTLGMLWPILLPAKFVSVLLK